MKRYLRRFLEELPNQTAFDSIEIILDHNDPEAEEIEWVQDFQSRYPGHLKHIVVRPVQPIGISMNRCVAQSSAEYLAIWNVDDLRTPRSIELQLRALQQDQAADIVYGDYTVVGKFESIAGVPVRHESIPESELTRSMILGPFFMFRRSLLQRAGHFDEQLRSGADFDLAVRLAFNGRAIHLGENLGYYLNEGLGASTRANSLQPAERTVIELRYGIYDKLDYAYLPSAVEYNVANLLKDGIYTNVRQFVPDYENILRERREAWLLEGIGRYYKRHRSVALVIRSARNHLRDAFTSK